MTAEPYFAPGDWNAVCDRCGRRFKASQMRKTWQGYYVCQRDWEPRHPQDFVRARQEHIVPPWVRPPIEPFVYPGPSTGTRHIPAMLPPLPPAYLLQGGARGYDSSSSGAGGSGVPPVLIEPGGADPTVKIWLRAEDSLLPYYDSSMYHRAHAGAGGIAVVTAPDPVYQGTSSYLFAGGGNIYYNPDSDLHLTNKDFYIRGAYYFSDTGTLRYLFGQSDVSGTDASISIALRRTALDELEAIVIEETTFAVYTFKSGSSLLPALEWHVIGLRRIGSSFSVLVDGNIVASATIASTINTSLNSFTFGRLGAFAGNSFDGYADEFIYQRQD